MTGIILAGGKSSRMGKDKALLSINGQALIKRQASLLLEVTDQVLLSTNDPAPYSFLGHPEILDAYPGRGPLAGLHAALLSAERPMILLLACDLPRVHTILLRNLIEECDGFDIAVPLTSEGKPHPVCAVYSRNCLPFVERCLRNGDNRMLCLMGNPSLKVRKLLPQPGVYCDADLVDLNSPSDFLEFRNLYES